MATQSKDYNFKAIESHWQAFWDENKTFKAQDTSEKKAYYVLDMLPYPSGSGLHIGHPEGYTATDIVGRKKLAEGYNVLHPMGWDAFGLPAEQHAISTGVHPAANTAENIKVFTRQLKSLGFGIDWDRELSTTDPEYYKWTQWIFLQLFKQGLAYVDEKPVWWCDALGTVLSNEEVIDGKSERGSHPVVRKNLRQWVLRITAYADKLLDGLEDIDWPDSTKRQQIAWIGRSEGTNIEFSVKGHAEMKLEAFTTSADTLFGASYIVLAPEHPWVKELTLEQHSKEVSDYIAAASAKSDLDRTELAKDKSGVFLGSYAINPINGQEIPIWIADYVLMSYGTGVVMGVPAHDERDYEFAQQYNLNILPVIEPKKGEGTEEDVPYFEREGFLINSGDFNGLSIEQGRKAITEALKAKQKADFQVQYKLRDWLFSRQRYWGEPFPIIWVSKGDFDTLMACESSPFHQFMPEEPVVYQQKNGETLYAVPLPQESLPLLLPEVESYKPSSDGHSPLANATDWVNVAVNFKTAQVLPREEASGDDWAEGVREVNTMPQWAGSCWYYLRYLDPKNADAFLDEAKASYWKTPDLYIGGAEHAVLHLLYARFWHKVLYDLGYVKESEPFKKLVHQGMILGELEFTAYKNAKGEYVSARYVADGLTDVRDGSALEAIKVGEDQAQKKGDSFLLKGYEDVKLYARAYKMSKSRGNVVSPDDVVAEHGADALRLYEMFLGPIEASKPWNTHGIEGLSRFLRKIWREYVGQDGVLSAKVLADAVEDSGTLRILHETIKKVTEDTDALRFNTAISQMMIFVNHLQKAKHFNLQTAKSFLQLLAPYAPHIAEELWARLGQDGSIAVAPWPFHDDKHLVQDTLKAMVQVNGKVRGEVFLAKGTSAEDALIEAKSHERVLVHIEGKQIVKEIYVPGKIINIVVK